MLRNEIAKWADLLSGSSPDYAAYRALNAGRESPTDKTPGVRPILAGEIWMRLISDVIHEKSKNTATIQCGNINLCTGLPAGIEGSLHAVQKIWPQSAGWTLDDDEEVQNTDAEMNPPELEGTSTAANDRGFDPGVS